MKTKFNIIDESKLKSSLDTYNINYYSAVDPFVGFLICLNKPANPLKILKNLDWYVVRRKMTPKKLKKNLKRTIRFIRSSLSKVL